MKRPRPSDRGPVPEGGRSQERVIAYFDVDCFYAQAEEVRDPRLKGRAIAVTQKFLCVTSKYAARAMGVTKLMPIKEAKRLGGGSLVLIPGEVTAATNSAEGPSTRRSPRCG